MLLRGFIPKNTILSCLRINRRFNPKTTSIRSANGTVFAKQFASNLLLRPTHSFSANTQIQQPTTAIDFYQIGLHCLQDSNDENQAENHFKKSISLDPQFGRAYSELASLYLRQNNWENAESMFKKSIEVEPQTAELYGNYGEALFSRKEYASAIQVVKAGLEHAPNNSHLLLFSAIIQQEMNDFYSSIQSAEKAVEQEPTLWPAWELILHLTQRIQDSKSFDKAIDRLAAQPLNTVDECFAVGRLLASVQKYSLSSIAFKKATELDPQNGESHYYLGESLWNENKHEEADQAHMKSVEFLNDAEKLFNLGYKKLSEHQIDVAHDIISKGLSIDPKHANGLSSYGFLLLQQGKVEEAVTKLEESLQVDPDNIAALFYISDAYLAQDKQDSAVQYIERLVKLKPDDKMAKVRLGECYEALDKYNEAMHIYQSMLNTPEFANDSMLHYRMGICFQAIEQHESALAEYKKIDTNNFPDPGFVYANIAAIYGSLGRTKDAIAEMEKALTMIQDPNGRAQSEKLLNEFKQKDSIASQQQNPKKTKPKQPRKKKTSNE